MNDTPKQASVMVVDDTPANLKLLTEILDNAGLRSLAFPNARMALQAAKVTPPDLFLLDIMMPTCDGFTLCKQLKAEDSLKAVPIIFISALQDSNSKVQAFIRGGVDYITKPFEEKEVLARVKTQLEMAQQRQLVEKKNRELDLSYNALRKAEEQRDELIHMLVHDMQSPLLGIRGFAELIQREAEQKKLEQITHFSTRICEAGERLRGMVANMLDISRMEASSLPLDIMHCRLMDIVKQAVTALEPIAEKRTLTILPDGDCKSIMGDPEIIRRVVENMLANAIKFTRADGIIEIGFFTDPEQAGVRIRDNGPGIPHADQQHIFEKYIQLSEGRKHKQQSSGLGLAFCKMAILAQNGRIGVESSEGTGSSFWFSLPQVQ